MKKAILLALACAFCLGGSMKAQTVEPVSYTEDASQGLLINSFKSNWFITVQGGANVFFSHYDSHRKFGDRFAPAANIYFGKWFTPGLGVRLGVDWIPMKGLGLANSFGALENEPTIDGLTKTRWNEVGPALDVMFNLTNLIGGYHPNRVYDLVVYGGGGYYFTYVRDYNAAGNPDGYSRDGDAVTIRGGIINSFNLSKRVALALDLRCSAIDGHHDYGKVARPTYFDVQAYLALTVKLGKTSWNAPVVPVYPEPENCDALRARLAAADSRIADLEAQLKDCLNRPVQTVKEDNAPLATIYYPIGVSRLTKEDKNVLGAIAEVMKSNSNNKYVLTGWADNYTGTEQINVRLRHARVDGVYNYLVKNGVPAAQLTSTINNGSLCDLGEKYVALDRAVTIEEAE